MKIVPASNTGMEAPETPLRIPSILIQSYQDLMKTPSGRADLKRISVKCGICHLTRYYSLTRGITRVNRVVSCEACRHCYQAFKREPIPVHCTKGDGSCWSQMMFPKTKCRCCWVTKMVEDTPILVGPYNKFVALLPEYIRCQLRGHPVKASDLTDIDRGYLALETNTGAEWKDVTHERAVAIQKMVFIDQPEGGVITSDKDDGNDDKPTDMWGDAAASFVTDLKETDNSSSAFTLDSSSSSSSISTAYKSGSSNTATRGGGTAKRGKPRPLSKQTERPSLDSDENSSTSSENAPPVSSFENNKPLSSSRGGSGKATKRSRGRGNSKVDRVMAGIKKGLYGISLSSEENDGKGSKDASATTSGSSSPRSGAPSPTPMEDDVTVEDFEDHPPAAEVSKTTTYKASSKKAGLNSDEQKKYLKDFNPRNSARVRRKKDRVEYFDTVKTQKVSDVLIHDHKGRFIALDRTTHDLCDCLQEDCAGCHFPCPKCRSTKCGAECRANRKWVYERVDVEGTDQFYVNKKVKH